MAGSHSGSPHGASEIDALSHIIYMAYVDTLSTDTWAAILDETSRLIGSDIAGPCLPTCRHAGSRPGSPGT
jgi:hypothetical protein